MSRPAVLSELERRIIDELQGGFPICPSPYAVVAERLGCDQATLLATLESLLERRILTRFGPLFQVERLGGAFVLAAMQVPEEDFERIAGLVNGFPEVAHNYRREHRFNMWFVLATGTPGGIAEVISRIEAATAIPVHAFPKEREFFVEMKLRVLP